MLLVWDGALSRGQATHTRRELTRICRRAGRRAEQELAIYALRFHWPAQSWAARVLSAFASGAVWSTSSERRPPDMGVLGNWCTARLALSLRAFQVRFVYLGCRGGLREIGSLWGLRVFAGSFGERRREEWGKRRAPMRVFPAVRSRRVRFPLLPLRSCSVRFPLSALERKKRKEKERKRDGGRSGVRCERLGGSDGSRKLKIEMETRALWQFE